MTNKVRWAQTTDLRAWTQSWCSPSALAVRARQYEGRTGCWRLDINGIFHIWIQKFGVSSSFLKMTFIKINGCWISNSLRLDSILTACMFTLNKVEYLNMKHSSRNPRGKANLRTRNMQAAQLLWQKWALSSWIPSKIPTCEDKWVWAEILWHWN